MTGVPAKGYIYQKSAGQYPYMDLLIGLVMASLILVGAFVGYNLWDDWEHSPDKPEAHGTGDPRLYELTVMPRPAIYPTQILIF